MRGTLFTPDNHRLVLVGLKTQTRRLPDLKKLGPVADLAQTMVVPVAKRERWCPYWPGGALYVKEGIQYDRDWGLFRYRLDALSCGDPTAAPLADWKKRDYRALFMPAAFARTFLRVEDVRLERLQSITDEDCIAEGCVARASVDPLLGYDCWYSHPSLEGSWDDPRECFRVGWESIHGRGAWDANPFVFRVQFRAQTSRRAVKSAEAKLREQGFSRAA